MKVLDYIFCNSDFKSVVSFGGWGDQELGAWILIYLFLKVAAEPLTLNSPKKSLFLAYSQNNLK